VQFRTRRYADNPLVVQGPGAGPDVTAAGVFGDVLAIAQSLGSAPGISAPLSEPRTEVHA
jgi:bifunctional aspartokinase / homoserine dehydrogenase 1